MRSLIALCLAVGSVVHAGSPPGIQIDTVVPLSPEVLRSQPWPAVRIAERAAEQAMPADWATALDAAWQRGVMVSSAEGVSAAVLRPAGGLWRSAHGLARLDQRRPMTVDTPLHAGSVGKIATAMLILQLIEEGQLGFDEPVGHLFPDWPAARDVSIDQLLTHTSGLYSFNWLEQVRHASETLSPKSLLAAVRDQPPLFPPGRALSYSNTGYLMLALIAERLRAEPYPDLLQSRILQPAGMRQSRAWIGGDWPEAAALGMEAGKQVPVFGTPHGAGALITTPADLCQLMAALLEGQAVSPALRERLLDTLYPMSAQGGLYAGRGIMWMDTPDGPWLHHGGSIGPFKADLAFSLRRGAVVAVMRNDGGPTTPFVYALLTALPESDSPEPEP